VRNGGFIVFNVGTLLKLDIIKIISAYVMSAWLLALIFMKISLIVSLIVLAVEIALHLFTWHILWKKYSVTFNDLGNKSEEILHISHQ